MAADNRHIYHKRKRLRQLRAFCRVAETGSITRASESLDLTQSVVSLHLRNLEYELQAVLFERTGRRIALSAAGERLYRMIVPLLQRMDDLSAAFVDESGDVRPTRIHLGASQAVATFVIPRYLRRFQELHPEVPVRVSVCLVSEGLRRLREDTLDFMLGTDEACLQGQQDIVYHRVACYDHVLITAPDHPLAERESVSPEEIAGFPAVVPNLDMYSRQSGDSAVERFGVDLNAAIEVGRWGVIKLYVEQGLGISIVPRVCLDEDDALSVVPLADEFPNRSYGVVVRRGKLLTPSARRLVQLMVPDFPA